MIELSRMLRGRGGILRSATSAVFAKAPEGLASMPEETLLTRRSRARKPSPIRALMPLMRIPGMISLGGGLPNPECFPIEGISLTFSDGKTVPMTPELLEQALQYSPTPGLPELVDRLSTFYGRIHDVPRDQFDVSVGVGSQDLLAKAFDAFLEEGDSILVEAPTYSGALAFLEPLGANIVPIETDADGLQPEALKRQLENWPKDTKKPRVLYTIPTGSNPTGYTLSEERRSQLLDIAAAHGLIVLEDDPYYFLQYSPEPVQSLFSMAPDRVLRFDSFSKVISSGLRLGTVTGPPKLVDKINLHTQATNLHASGVSQAMLLSLFRHWAVGDKGVLADVGMDIHIKQVKRFYEQRCQQFLDAADRHLAGLATYARPTAGMFVWLKLHGVEDSFNLVKEIAEEEKVLFVPGSAFYPRGTKSPYIRASFSLASAEQMDEALRRLAAALKKRK